MERPFSFTVRATMQASANRGAFRVSRKARDMEYRADWIAPDLVATHDALEVWARWTRARPVARRDRAGSAEGSYRAPWRQWHYPSAEELMPRPSELDALALDRIVNALPDPFRLLIVWHYARRAPIIAICRVSRIKRDRYGPMLNDARRIVRYRLTRAHRGATLARTT